MKNHDPPGGNAEGDRLSAPTPLEGDRTTRHVTSDSRRLEDNERSPREARRWTHVARSAGTTIQGVAKMAAGLIAIWRLGKIVVKILVDLLT